MILKISSFINKIHPMIWQITCLSVSLGAFSLILVNRSPNLFRPISMALRTGFGLVIPLTFIVTYLAFCIPNRLGQMAGYVTTLTLFAMPLAGLWASGQTQSTVLSGIIPLYDAEAYYIDALRLINGYKFSVFSARRPLFTGLLATLLSWTGQNLMLALAILTAIVGIACYLSAREIQRTHGAEMAVFVLIILFLFFRAHSGISMSENLGIALGTLGFALLWQGAFNKNILYLWSGMFVTTLALNARAGAFFVLPLLILWTGWLFRENKKEIWKSMFAMSTATMFGFFLNIFITRIVAVPSGVPFANFSYTLYGLAAGGKSWTYIFYVHPELISIQEPEKTKMIYQLALESIRAHPNQIIQGAIYNWKMLFSNSWYNIYSYIGGENWIINTLARWMMYFLGATGIYTWFKDSKDPIKSLIMVTSLGVFLSVPFLPPTDAYRMRPYAASVIILAALPALGLGYIFGKIKLILPVNISNFNGMTSAPLYFSMILIMVTLIGPLVLIKFRTPPTSLTPVSCTNTKADFVLIRFNEGSYINVKKQNLSFLDWMPNYHAGQFRTNAHSLADINLISWAVSLQPPITILNTFNFYTGKEVLITLQSEIIPVPEKYYQFCGRFETERSLSPYTIFYADEVLPLPQ